MQVPASTLCSIAASAASEPSAGLSKLPARGSANAARDSRAYFQRWGLIWKVPLSNFRFTDDGHEIDVPYISPLKFIPFLLERAPAVLFGGLDATTGQKMNASFWESYKAVHGSHRVFEDHMDNLGTVLPISVHGDEGRGVRKGNTCVLSLETVFGWQTRSNCRNRLHYGDCKCCSSSAVDLGQDVLQCADNDVPLTAFQAHHIKGHPFLNKMLAFCLPSKMYKTNNFLDLLLEQICLELKQLYHEGVWSRGRYWHAAVISFKGDLAWLVKVGRLTRCYKLSDYAMMCH